MELVSDGQLRRELGWLYIHADLASSIGLMLSLVSALVGFDGTVLVRILLCY